jgi:hypothetical protein
MRMTANVMIFTKWCSRIYPKDADRICARPVPCASNRAEGLGLIFNGIRSSIGANRACRGLRRNVAVLIRAQQLSRSEGNGSDVAGWLISSNHEFAMEDWGTKSASLFQSHTKLSAPLFLLVAVDQNARCRRKGLRCAELCA